MLPFLKKKEIASANAEDEPMKRKPDDPADSFEMLDAVVDDMFEALEKKNKKLLKSALEALCDYVQDKDEAQDEQLINEEV